MRVTRHRLPSDVARRLLERGTPVDVAARVLAQRDKQLTYTPQRDAMYVYWDVVLMMVARRSCVSLHPRVKARSEAMLGIATDQRADGWYWRFAPRAGFGDWCGPFPRYADALFDAALQDEVLRGDSSITDPVGVLTA